MNIVSPEKVFDVEQRLARLGVRAQDLVEKFIRAGGPGGQKVNKTSSAVYLKHLPTGTEVKSQVSRSQSQNRFYARRLLVEKLEAQQQGEKNLEQQRVEKIRRQKRKRSRRAKEKLLADKRHHAQKKESRSRDFGD